jgi:hypothetical protein
MIATLAVFPLLLVFKRSSDGSSAPVIVSE